MINKLNSEMNTPEKARSFLEGVRLGNSDRLRIDNTIEISTALLEAVELLKTVDAYLLTVLGSKAVDELETNIHDFLAKLKED